MIGDLAVLDYVDNRVPAEPTALAAEPALAVRLVTKPRLHQVGMWSAHAGTIARTRRGVAVGFAGRTASSVVYESDLISGTGVS